MWGQKICSVGKHILPCLWAFYGSIRLGFWTNCMHFYKILEKCNIIQDTFKIDKGYKEMRRKW